MRSDFGVKRRSPQTSIPLGQKLPWQSIRHAGTADCYEIDSYKRFKYGGLSAFPPSLSQLRGNFSRSGLAFKAYSFEHSSSDYGGIYFWRDAASSKAWFSDAWHQRVQVAYGHSATIEWFDLPILLPTQDVDNNPRGRASAWAWPLTC